MSHVIENILVIGSGGREHALGWKLDGKDRQLFFAPGNGGTVEIGKNIDISAHDVSGLVEFADDHSIDLTVVGPEQPLAEGIVDAFEEDDLSIFGPTQQAAQLETSKAFSARFMERHNIPHPTSRSFSDIDEAKAYIEKQGVGSIVIKADGLAAGKGVVLPHSNEEAVAALRAMMIDHQFGEAGNEVVIQERLVGPELSALAFCDGNTAVLLLPARDHKRAFDNDTGPNTGGMGAFAPVPGVTPEDLEQIHRTILQPTVDGMREEGTPYKGILYAGLILTDKGPKVLEYNARFGDPETQPLMMLLKSDLAPLLLASINGTLVKQTIRFRDGAAACIVLASAGYPGLYGKGKEIHLQQPNSDIAVSHAGTLLKDGKLVTSGGRVLGVTAYGPTLREALKRAYGYIAQGSVSFDGMQYRKDIGEKGVTYELSRSRG